MVLGSSDKVNSVKTSIKTRILLAASRQGFKYCTWGVSSKMYINTEDIKFEIYVKISTGTTISQEMLKQTVNKNNIHVPIGVSQVLKLVVIRFLTNQRLLRHVISRDYITHEFRVIPKHSPATRVNNTTSHFRLEVV